jgi:hypothetical protein
LAGSRICAHYSSVRIMCEKSLALRRGLGDKPGIATSLAGLGGVAIGEGHVERGAGLLGAIEGLLQSMGGVLNSKDRLLFERHVQQVRALLGEEAFERAWQEGRGMSLAEAADYALEGVNKDR